MRHRRLLVCCLAMLLGTSASAAAPRVRVALHLSEVVDATPNDVARVHAIVAETLSRHGAKLAGPDRVEAFFAARPQHSCAPLSDVERTQCLAELARGVDADRSVLVTVAPYAGERIILTAQVVSSGGTVLQEIEPSAYPRASKAALQQSIGTALHDFVPKLQIFEQPATSSTAQPTSTGSDNTNVAHHPPRQPPDATAASPSPIVSGLSPRTTGIIIAGAGLALGGVGGFYLRQAGMGAGRFNERYRSGSPGIEEEVALAGMRSDATRQQIIGIACIGAGVAALFGGGFVIWTDARAKRPHTSLSWLVAPGSIAVRIETP
ncbi:MAG TPA: hypothetical protein VE618_06010 [Myxococcaceae bacterium]|nr:hypothetical protein [Myxococcaceae bacterium]